MAALTHALDLLGPYLFWGTIVGLAALVVYLIRYHQIGAIIRNTIAQAIRIKAAFAIMLLYLVLVPTLPFLVEGDGTLRGLLHVVVGYSLIAAGVLLGILTLALSTTTLWSELHEKQIYLLEAKPVRRWQILLGKLLGILAIDGGLLAFMALVTWACVAYHARRSTWPEVERHLAREQVLAARRLVQPLPDDLARTVNRAYDELKRRGRLPENQPTDRVKKQIHKELVDALNALGPRERRHWRFAGLRYARRPQANFTLRFKFATSSRTREEPVQTLWEVGDRASPDFFRYVAAYPPDEVHEVQLPARAIARDGTLDVYCYNIEPASLSLVFSGDEAMVVLVRVACFASNLARGLWLVFVEVLFLAILGLFCSTFMSFPVSPVVALSLYVLIYLAGAVKSEFDQGLHLIDNAEHSRVASALEKTVRGITEAVRFLLPPFDRYAASTPVSSGEEVSWWRILEATATVALVRGGLLVFLGIVIFERRELALAGR